MDDTLLEGLAKVFLNFNTLISLTLTLHYFNYCICQFLQKVIKTCKRIACKFSCVQADDVMLAPPPPSSSRRASAGTLAMDTPESSHARQRDDEDDDDEDDDDDDQDPTSGQDELTGSQLHDAPQPTQTQVRDEQLGFKL